MFPDEIYAAPRSWAEKAYPKLIHYNRLDKGGHFAAWEQPALFCCRNAHRVPSAAPVDLKPSSGRALPRVPLPNTHIRSANMNRPERSSRTEDIRLERRLPTYWRVTFDMPPVNIFGPKHLPLLNDIITAIETDPEVKVVVFDSAVEGFFITHYDFLAPLEDSLSVPPGPTGLQALPDMLVRLSRAPVVSIASIRGRATGVGSELALASDMRFASREKAILSQWEVGAGLVPGGGPMARLPRLMGRGRALEVLLGADDIHGDLAERYGYVNRSLPDAELDGFVEALAMRIASFDKEAIAETKRLVDVASLPPDDGDQAGVGRVPGRARPSRQPDPDQGADGARLPPRRRRREPARLPRRSDRRLTEPLRRSAGWRGDRRSCQCRFPPLPSAGAKTNLKTSKEN